MGTEAKIHCTFTDKSLCHGSLGLDTFLVKREHTEQHKENALEKDGTASDFTHLTCIYTMYIYIICFNIG